MKVAPGYLCKQEKMTIIIKNKITHNLGRLARMKETTKGISIRSLFSRNLKRLRRLANISQVDLAAEADLTHNFINDIENGKKWVSAETIGKLSKALKAEPYQFFISESKWDNQGAVIFSHYLKDFTDSFNKVVKEYRSRYLPDSVEDETQQKPDDT